MGLSKTDYAKYQFMILVLRILIEILAHVPSDQRSLILDTSHHIDYIENLMKEE